MWRSASASRSSTRFFAQGKIAFQSSCCPSTAGELPPAEGMYPHFSGAHVMLVAQAEPVHFCCNPGVEHLRIFEGFCPGGPGLPLFPACKQGGRCRIPGNQRA